MSPTIVVTRILGVVTGVALLVAITVLHWAPRATGVPKLGLTAKGVAVDGGAYSIGRGLWGIGIGLDWILPLAVVALVGVAAALFLGHRWWPSALVAASGASALALVAAIGSGGTGFVVAVTAGSILILAGPLAMFGSR